MDILDVKNTIPEIKNLLKRFKNRLDASEVRIGELELSDIKKPKIITRGKY